MIVCIAHNNNNTSISIGGGAWQLKTPALYYYATGSNRIQGQSHYGWIGLGTGSEAHQNFQNKNPTFSLLLNTTPHGTGSLIFGFDSSIADIDNPLMVLTSDSNWKIQMTSIWLGSIVYSDTSQPIPMMFDLLYQGISFPKNILKSLMNQMNIYNLICYGSGCYTDSLDDLPSLTFGLADGKNFSLRPQDYLKPVDQYVDGQNYMSLWFKNIENNYMYSEDYIMLGWDVLASFYTLFQQVDGINTISFYEINSATSPKPSITPSDPDLDSYSSSILLIPVVTVVILLICVSVAIYITRKNKFKKEMETMELSKVETSEMPVDSQEQSHFL